MSETVDVICSVLNGARFLPDLLDSLSRQTHADWRLWVRDDGSSDASVQIVRDRAAEDPRVVLMHAGGPRLGIAGAYGWLLERVPPDSTYVMTADVDDVWLPRKIEQTLAAMRQAEAESSPATPILVHTDLVVVNERLEVIHPSFWTLTALDPEPATVRRQVVRTLVAAPTLMLNRALREAVGPVPPGPLYQDWWFGLVAVALGRIVPVREATVLYRQHGGNAVGARDTRITLATLPATIARGWRGRGAFRVGLEQVAVQAQAFLDRYEPRLADDDRELLGAFARLPRQPFLARKIDAMRYRVVPGDGVLRALGVLLRA